MTDADLALIQNYFKEEGRNPSETEIKVLDTYWSDHCRHTTFATVLKNIEFPKNDLGKAMEADYLDFLKKREVIYGANQRDISLMELATIDAKYQRKIGNLEDVEFSAEINACSVFVKVDEEGEQKDWLLQFKNETHNHPTEIEPFGGASTCIGGAIRDPLSGRAYVYQALRISGSADPRENIADTLPNKLPQRVIAQRSAQGNSSYGNQIGLPTGQVVELYHQGYKAKHLEVGAVVGACPLENVRREQPQEGDLIMLLGGKTGRDGCGGATGSSKEHNSQSLETSAAEVQKGNAPEERKLQRLFKNPEFSKLVKRCNDFGAGGVSVAVGELAEGLEINLDAVPVKYQGLSGTELAISESQERMAIVIEAKDKEKVIELSSAENLTATEIATVKADKRLKMFWRKELIVDIKRSFLDTNGAKAEQNGVSLEGKIPLVNKQFNNWREELKNNLSDLNNADLRGLGDRFDFNVGASCVLKPYGGKYSKTPIEASVYLLPTEKQTTTASILAYGFNPDYSSQSPYQGAMYAIAEAASRLIATGGDIKKAHFSLQEYFPRLGTEPKKWGLPFASLLGAHYALNGLNRAAIGGKDSMSGSFNNLEVPPTLIAFAVSTVNVNAVQSAEFKKENSQLYWLRCPYDDLERPNFATILKNNEFILDAIKDNLIRSIRSIRQGGLIQAIYEAVLGNKIGANLEKLPEDAFKAEYGGFLIEADGGLGVFKNLYHLGQTTAEPIINIAGEKFSLEEGEPLRKSLKDVYTLNHFETEGDLKALDAVELKKAPAIKSKIQPQVLIPVFYGMNSELDTAYAFASNGGKTKEVMIRNRNQEDISNSITQFAKELSNSQILAICGGFSAGDEPDGSGKFIANVLFNSQIAEAIANFLNNDGLILGICNGFQALIKTGLLPFGEIRTPKEGDPTLTHNRLNRHIARIVKTVITNNSSIWLNGFKIGDAHDVAISHGEGRFFADDASLKNLIANGQIATQYANPFSLNPSMRAKDNPNGSLLAIEGITSPDGRILGKMGHSERYKKGTYKNHPEFTEQNIFANAVKAFS